MKIAIIYLVVVNLISFFSMLSDKRRAEQGRWRISEKALFFWAIIGGSIGSIIGMHLFRHKTKHWYFLFGMPAILVVQVVLAMIVLHFFG